MTTSSVPTIKRFPCFRHPSDPPALRGTIVDGRKTPLYGLGWVCSPQQLSRNLGGVTTLGGPYRDVIKQRWKGPHVLTPRATYAENGKFYSIAVWNRPHAGMTAEDMVDQSREALSIDKNSRLEQTFAWYRFPLSWAGEEEDDEEEALKEVRAEEMSMKL